MLLSWIKKSLSLCAILLLGIAGCTQNDRNSVESFVPPHFPPMPLPEDFSFEPKRVELGRALFFERKLSRFEDASCGTCHIPQLAFTDTLTIAKGTEGRLGFRNTPSLGNAAYLPNVFYDGGVPTIERQMIAPFNEHAEFDFPLDSAIMRLSESAYYIEAFRDVFDSDITTYGMSRANAAYLRTLTTSKSAYDLYLQGDENALTAQQKRGRELFFSTDLQCSNCHTGVLLTDYAFRHNGLYRDGDSDKGRGRVTRAIEDMGKFKTPSLRNVSRTAPYMHDGRFRTLEEVIDHYAKGEIVHPNQDPVVDGFQISETEKEDLISFLRSFEDLTFGNM